MIFREIAATTTLKKNQSKVYGIEKSYGLVIDWVGPDKVEEFVPGLNTKGLLGGIYSPYEGNMSPLFLINAYARRSGI